MIITCTMQFTDLQVVISRKFRKNLYMGTISSKNSESLRGKLKKKSLHWSIFRKNLFFDPISSGRPREILISTQGAEILKFETTLGINLEFTLSWGKTEGGCITLRQCAAPAMRVTLWVGRHQPASHVAPALDRQPGLRREDSLVGAQYLYLF